MVIGGVVGGVIGGMITSSAVTVMVTFLVSVEVPSVTEIGKVKLPAVVGVQEKRPVVAPMVAPEGAPDPKENVSALAFGLIAVAVKVVSSPTFPV